jgi:hypothetical protein
MTPLDTWLAKATDGLSAESAAQVRAEIGEHYQSAHQAAVNLGASPREADVMAVAALGDAKSANRQYRRVLLTLREAKLLEAMNVERGAPAVGPHPTLARWAARILMAEAVAGLLFAAAKDHAWSYFAMALAGMWVASRFAPVRTPSRSRVYRVAKWAALLGAVTLVGWYGSGPWWVGMGALVAAGYWEYVRMSIRRKLPVAQWPRRLFL